IRNKSDERTGERFSTSIASKVLQQGKTSHEIRKICRDSRHSSRLLTQASAPPVGRVSAKERLQSPGRGVDRFQSACNMRYDACVRWLTPLMRAKRQSNVYLRSQDGRYR